MHDDLVERQFHTSAPDLVWVTDITEHPTSEGKLSCCAIKDLFGNRIVGYAIDERMTAQVATNALRSPIARRRPTRTVVVASDRGSQCRARTFRVTLDRGRAHRIHGPCRRGRRQRRDGELLGAASCRRSGGC